MQRLTYILVYPIIWLISILPFRLLYMLSDVLFVVVYYIVGYRKKVVFENLTLAFPEKSTEEIKEIQKKSYRHFVDIFMEMIKSFTISKKELDKRFTYTNIDIFKQFEKDNKSIMIYAAHYANWEWVFGLNPSEQYQKCVVFKKISNPYFDDVVKKSRSRFGLNLKYTYEIKRVIEYNFNTHTKTIYGFLSDQSPRMNRAEYWRNYMNVYVPVHTAAENFAKRYDMNVLYLSTKRIKRGYYENTFHILSTNAKECSNFSITDKYIDLVEQQLREQPEFYFWTHRRFKHRNKAKK